MELQGQKIVVVGMGRTALSAVKLLLREGARPRVSEVQSRDLHGAACAELEALGVPYECGGHSARFFEGARLILPGPGVPPGLPVIAEACGHGARLICELDLAFAFCPARVIAVTGTNGKTTATALLSHLVLACGHAALLAGNNDLPFSAAVLEPTPLYVVLEVSSYQLALSNGFKPWIGAVLNLTPDHLARHNTLEEYAAAKARMFARQSDGDIAVVNDDDPWTAGMRVPARAARLAFSMERAVQPGLWLDGEIIREGRAEVARVTDTRLLGRHNLSNVLAALTIMRAGGFDWPSVLEGLRSFAGVEHRIEFVATIGQVDYYNDSKSTNIDSLRVALDSFDRPVVLIAGGEGKGSDYRVLRDLIRGRVKHLVTLGSDAPVLEAAFADLVETERAASLGDAVERAAALARPGEVVLLSPACASFDMFKNFEERGRVFKQCVGELARKVKS